MTTIVEENESTFPTHRSSLISRTPAVEHFNRPLGQPVTPANTRLSTIRPGFTIPPSTGDRTIDMIPNTGFRASSPSPAGTASHALNNSAAYQTPETSGRPSLASVAHTLPMREPEQIRLRWVWRTTSYPVGEELQHTRISYKKPVETTALRLTRKNIILSRVESLNLPTSED